MADETLEQPDNGPSLNVIRVLNRYWGVVSFLLMVIMGSVAYIHSLDMTKVNDTQALAQALAQNLGPRVAVVEERSIRTEKVMEEYRKAQAEQNQKLDEILSVLKPQGHQK